MPTRFVIALALLLCPRLAEAQKKPVTIESLQQTRFPDSGGTPVWAPDGKRFVFRQDSKVFLYDVAAKSQKELFALAGMEKLALRPSTPRAFGWENQRVQEAPLQWAPDGKSLLCLVFGDLFLWSESGGSEQRTKTEAPERDPKLSPDGTRVSFRRQHDLYVMDLASKKTTRLTADGSENLLNGELDWVYPEELNLGTEAWW